MPDQPPAARSWRLNVRSLVTLSVLLALGVAAVASAWMLQQTRGRSALVTQARRLMAGGKDDLALSFLNQYLDGAPRDLEALDLKGEVLARSARSPEHLDEVIKLSESILRLDPRPRDESGLRRSLATRRRLVEAYLARGPLMSRVEASYTSAETLARGLADQTGEAADLRLHAQALERLGALGNSARLAEAAARYEQARAKDPRDVAVGEQAARLYFFRLKDPARARAVLESLTRDGATAPALLAAARVYAEVAAGHTAEADAAAASAARAQVNALLARAVAIAPRDRDVRLAAADVALTNRRPAEAAEHLAQIQGKDREDHRFRTLEGLVALYQNKTADALESWRSGLIATAGSDAELSWRLAFVLLHLGRIEEADLLIAQFRRNYGGEEVPPAAHYLEGLKQLKLNRPAAAAAELEKGRAKVPATLKPQYYYALGQAREASRDEMRAMEAYGVALAADPKMAAPRLARARMLRARRPEDAAEELTRGLAEAGEDPTLLAALAELELRKQLRVPAPRRRDWAPLQGLLERGRRAAPGLPALAILTAEALAAQGKAEDAVAMLARATAIDKTDVELWAARAERLAALGRLGEALMVLDQASDPKAAGDQARLRILRARILTLQGHGREARDGLVRDLERVRLDQRPQLWKALGELYTAQGDAKGARQAFATWAELLPEDPLPRLAVLEMALSDPSGDTDATVRGCLRALEAIGGLYGRVGEALYLLRDRAGSAEPRPEREARLARAAGILERVEAEAPRLHYAPLLRGFLAEQRQDLAAAASSYEKALKAEGGLAALPRLVRLYGQMKGRDADLRRLAETYAVAAPGIGRLTAETYARQGEKDKAAELARRVAAGDPESLDVQVWQARVLNTLGRPEEAEKTLRALIEKDPGALGPWLALEYFQVGRKDQAGAVATVEAMIRKVQDVPRPELVWAQAWRVAGETQRADSAFEAALARWPDDPGVTRAAAQYYEAGGRRAQAEKVLRDVLARDASQRWAARGLAVLLSARAGDPESWASAWALVKDPVPGGDLPEDRLIRAIVLARGPEARNRAEATGMLGRLVEDLPADLPAAATARGLLTRLVLPDDPARAADLAAIDARAPSAGPAELTLHAEALIAAKRLDEADRQVGRLVALAPEGSTSLPLRMRLARARGQGAQAAEALEREAATKIDGPDGEAAGRLMVQTLLLELDQPAAAERVAGLLKARYPKTSDVLAAVLARQGRRDEALKLYLDAIEQGEPAQILEAARNTLALIARDQSEPASVGLAETVIDAARRKDPKSPELLAMAGYVRHFQGRYDEEVRIYEEALAGKPNDPQLLNNLAWTLSEGLKRPEQALTRIDEAIRKGRPVRPQFYDTRGVIYTRLGRHAEAIRDLELAVLDRPTGLVWAHLARAYHKAGKADKFREARGKARSANPPLTPEAVEALERAELVPLIFEDVK